MNIVIERIFLGDKYTIGKLYVDGVYLCDTLEQPVRDIEFGSAVKYGTYQVNFVWSPKFHRYMLRLEVPHRCGILIHAGNSVKDTTGCILLGENKVVGRLLNSRKYVEILRSKVIEAMTNQDSVVICSVDKK